MRPRADADLLTGLAEISLLLRTTGDLDAIAGLVTDTARSALGIAESRIFLIEDQTGSLRPLETGKPGLGDLYLPPAGGVLEWLMRLEEPVFAAAPLAGGPSLEEGLWGERHGAFFGLPLRAAGRLLGLWVATLASGHAFSARDRLLAHVLADLLCLALERRRADGTLAEREQQVERLEARAEEGETLLAQMLSVVAHEMRTPLTCIKAYTEALLDATEEQWSDRVPFLEIINEESDRLGRLLTNALDYSRLGSGQRSLHLTTFLPGDLLHDVARTLGPDAKRQKVELAIRVPVGFGSVEGDLDLLNQLCINLAGNAVKFSPQGSTVELEVAGDGDHWRLEVRDRGPGIPDDHKERIFERFYRVEQDGRHTVPGTGLGLAIARGITELHGGRVWVEARAGGGSRFLVDLPRAQHAPEPARRVAGQLWAHGDVTRLLGESVRMISEAMEAQIVSAMLVDPDRGDLRVAAALGLDESASRRRVGFRGGISGKALAQGAPVLVNDIETDPRFQRPNLPQYFTKSLLCVPIAVDGVWVGVINVNNKRSRQPFDETDLALLSTLVERLGGAMNRWLASPEAPADVHETLAGLCVALDPRGERAAYRQTPQQLAYAVARRLGVGDSEARRLGRLAEAVRDGFERSPGASGERAAATEAVIRAGMGAGIGVGAGMGAAAGVVPGVAAARHAPDTERGDITSLGSDADILLGRHEWWDGSGHPRGLAGARIPLGARVLAVVDLLQSLLRGNPGRAPLAGAHALAELARWSGRRVDGRIVEVTTELLAGNGDGCAARLGEGSPAYRDQGARRDHGARP